MQTVDLLVTPRWLVPIEPEGVVLEAHALVVDAGRIEAVLPLAEAQTRYQARETVALPQHAVLPGLVNLHTHAAMSLLRGIADDLPLMDWLQNHIWPAEGAHVGAAFCEDGLRLAFAEMIRGGTTCVNDMYFFPDATARVARETGLRATVGLVVFDFPTAWGSGADDYIHKGLALHDALRDTPLVRTIFAPHAPYTVSDAPLQKIRRYANELGIGIHMHVHETEFEVVEAVKQSGRRPWARLKALELLGPDFIAVHMTQLTDAEIAEAAEYGVHIAHCPESNLKLASGFCPVDKLLKAGANVGIGTDGAASNNRLDLLAEMRLAALLAKGASGNAQALGAHQALQAATLAGARALGMEDKIGTIESGKAADLCAIDLSSPELSPCYDPASHAVYAAGREHVSHVWVAGQLRVENGSLCGIGKNDLISLAKVWQNKIRD